MSNKYNWLRWVGLFPCAIAVYLLIYLSLRVWMRTSSTPGLYDIMDFVAPALAGIGSAYCYIWTGVKIAPSNKITTALVLLIILILSTGAAIYVDALARRYDRIIEDAFSIVGLVIAYKEVEKKNKVI